MDSPIDRTGAKAWPAVAAHLIQIAKTTRTADAEYAKTGEWQATEAEILAAVADLRQFTHYLRAGTLAYVSHAPSDRNRYAEQIRLKESTRSVLHDLGLDTTI